MRALKIYNTVPALVALVLALTLAGCDGNDIGSSIFDPNWEAERPSPIVSSVEPTSTALAGVGRVVIHGENFVPGETVVFFDGARATILEESTDRLVVRVPNYEADPAKLRVTVLGAEYFSEERDHRLIPAIRTRGAVLATEVPQGMTVDAAGNIYYATLRGGVPAGVIRIPAAAPATEEPVSPPQGWTYVDLAMLPDGRIVLARGLAPLVYVLDPAVGGIPTVYQQAGGLGRVDRLTTDDQGNVWTTGLNVGVYRITPERQITHFPFPTDPRAIRVHDGHVYVLAARPTEGDAGVWRGAIINGTMTFEPYFIFNDHTELAGATPQAMEVMPDGRLFVTTGRRGYYMVEIHPDGQWNTFYSNLATLQPQMTRLTLGPDNYLFAVRQATQYVTIGGATTTSAPAIVRIDLNWQEGR
jgi:hypothetical protein